MPDLPGSPPVEITLRRSARARRFSLRVSRLDGQGDAVAARRRARGGGDGLCARPGGLASRDAGRDAAGRAPSGLASVLPVEGRPLTLRPGTGAAVRVEGESLLIPGDPAPGRARVAAFLKTLARDRLTAGLDPLCRRWSGARYCAADAARHAVALGVLYARTAG